MPLGNRSLTGSHRPEGILTNGAMRMRRYWIVGLIVSLLIALCAFWFFNDEYSFERRLGLDLPHGARIVNQAYYRVPSTIIVRAWFEMEVPYQEANALCRKLGVPSEEAWYSIETWPPKGVREWFKPPVAPLAVPVDRFAWFSSSGDFDPGTTYAVWCDGKLWLYREGIGQSNKGQARMALQRSDECFDV